MLIQIIILLVLAFAAWFFWQQLKRQKQSLNTAQASPNVSDAGIEQVRAGAVIGLPPHGKDLQAGDVSIVARHVYNEDGFKWYELEGESADGRVWIDVCRDDELETSISLERLTLAALALDVDSFQQLLKSGKARITYDGCVYQLDEKGEAAFYPEGDVGRAEAYHYWDFEGDDDKHDLSVERWGNDYRAYISERLDPARIRIYSLGGEA